MAMGEGRAGLLPEGGAGEVQPVELFFDLVYVLAVTQLTQYLVDHLSPRGAAETSLLLLAVWGAWIHMTWTMNYFDRGARSVRLMLIGVMLASLILSSSVSEAFGQRGLAFATALVAVLAGGTALALAGIGLRHHLSAVFGRVLIWWLVIGVLWLLGGLVDGGRRVAVWLVADALIYSVMWLRFPLPGLGRFRTSDYTISGAHIAERCQLFIIVALGESILVTGADFGEVPASARTVAAFVVAFAGSVTLWWLYFDRAEEAARRVIAAASDPGRLAISAYSFFHIPMVAGIIATAAADELMIAHPAEEATVATTALILGGPALYLLGNVLFKWAVWHHLARQRLVAIGALIALIPLALVSSRLTLMIAAMLVLVGLALWDLRAELVGRRSTLTDAVFAPPRPVAGGEASRGVGSVTVRGDGSG